MTSPEIDKALEAREPKVLKISEGALNVDGAYLGEIGNYGGRPREGMFEYHPAIGLEVYGGRNAATLDLGDKLALPQDFGYLSVGELFGDEERVMSDVEFARAVSETWQVWRARVAKVDYLAQVETGNAGIGETEMIGAEYAAYRLDASAKDRFWHPRDVVKEALEVLDGNNERLSFSPAEALEKTGVLDEDPREARKGIVGYFYLYAQVAGIDVSSVEGAREAIRTFRYASELVDQYEERPDGRFGDVLVQALELELKADEPSS